MNRKNILKRSLIGLVLIQALTTSVWAMEHKRPSRSSSSQLKSVLGKNKRTSEAATSKRRRGNNITVKQIVNQNGDITGISVTAPDGSTLDFELNLFTCSNVFQAATEVKNPEDPYLVSAAKSLLQKQLCQSALQTGDDLEIFKLALDIINDWREESTLTITNVLVHALRIRNLSFEQTLRHWSMAFELDINELSVALAALLAEDHASQLQSLIKINKQMPLSCLSALRQQPQHPGGFALTSLPSSMTYQEIEKFIINNYAQPGFNFLEWYNRLPAGRKPSSARTRVLAALDKQAIALVDNATTRIDEKTGQQVSAQTAMVDVKTAFNNMPEGYFRMQVRQAYRQKFNVNIDHLNIADIMERINDAEGDIDLPRQRITTENLVGIHDLLTVRNEVQPIEMLDLNDNQLAALPQGFGQGWNQLWALNLNNNQLAALPQGFGQGWNQLMSLDLKKNKLITLPQGFGQGWTQLIWLHLDHNQLNDPARTQLQNLRLQWQDAKRHVTLLFGE